MSDISMAQTQAVASSLTRQPWYFTFGHAHVHPTTGESLESAYVVVTGTLGEARDAVNRAFNGGWAFQHPTAAEAGVGEKGLHEVPMPVEALERTTYVLFVTDASGSMQDLAADVRGGFNAYLEDLRRQEVADGPVFRLSVTLFHTEMRSLCSGARLAGVPAFTADNYKPGGGTALLDAVGATVTAFRRDVTLADEDRVLLVIQTDGEENASREWTWPGIQNLLDAAEQTGKWSIVYLGQGRDAWAQGHRFGASTQTVATGYSSKGTAASYTGLSKATVNLAAGSPLRSVGVTIAATPGIADEAS